MPWKKGNKVQLVREQDASPGIAAIYNEIKQAFGLRYVSAVHQAYAGFPHFLDLHWDRLRPAIQSRKFFELADRLRADAYTRAHNYFEIPDLCARMQALSFSPGAKEELSETVEQFFYADPAVLLVTAAQQQAFEGPAGIATDSSLPVFHPQFERKPILVSDESASPEISKIFEEMKRDYGIPTVISDFRALARWPDFLRSYWTLLHPLLSSPLYQECQYGIRETAWSLAKELPGPFELTVAQMTEAGMTEDDIASVVRLTQAFTRGFSGMTLNIAIAKIGVEGGNHPQIAESDEQKTPSRAPTQAA